MLLGRETSQLMLIDLQDRLVPAIEDGAARVEVAARLLAAARLLGVPVLATEHMAERIGGTVPALAVSSDEVFDKATFSALRQTGFRDMLSRQQIVICGTETHVCVMQTALDLHEAGFAVAIVEDAVGSRFAVDRAAALTRMRDAGLTLVTAETVMFEWLERGDAPEFRDVLALIKGRT